MLARSYGAAVWGVDGVLVEAEASVSLGLPGLAVIGRAAGALHEARERVRAALAHVFPALPPRKVVVNLAPADVRKDSPGLDLAIALAMLAAHEEVPQAALEGTVAWGELGLDGAVRPAAGTLVAMDVARRAGVTRAFVAAAAAPEAALLRDIAVYEVHDLAQLVAHLRDGAELPRASPAARAVARGDGADLSDVRGLPLARQALEVMAAGGHHLLLHGSPGVGKTMLARRVIGLLPDLEESAALEVTKIHGVAGLRPGAGLLHRPPLRMPHHTVSAAGLLGGGSVPRPGEVSLAHRGVLFLDELPELSRACLEGLREPLEDGEVRIVRAEHTLHLPARFQLLAAMNPCPCGFYGHPERACVDGPRAVARYQARISGPLLDRFDLLVPIVAVPRAALGEPGEATAVVRQRVEAARALQAERLRGTPWRTNAEVPAHGRALDGLCPLTSGAERLLRGVAERRGWSLRVQHRIRRLARTIADLRRPSADPRAPLIEDDVAAAVALREPPERLAEVA